MFFVLACTEILIEEGAFCCPFGVKEVDIKEGKPLCFEENKYGLGEAEEFDVTKEEDTQAIGYRHVCEDKVMVGLNKEKAYCAPVSSELSIGTEEQSTQHISDHGSCPENFLHTELFYVYLKVDNPEPHLLGNCRKINGDLDAVRSNGIRVALF